MITSGIKAYRKSIIINIILSLLALGFGVNVSCGILLSTLVYFIYLWTLDYGITKAFNDRDNKSVVIVLVFDTIFFGLLLLLGFILDNIFSLIGILIGVFSCKILYVMGVIRG